MASEENNHYLYKTIQSTPQGKIKLAIGLEKLLETKDFNSITTAEISKKSGVNESLIYRYFKDKWGMLHYILAEHQKNSLQQFYSDLICINGAVSKLKYLIWKTLDNWNKERVYAKILLIEVRNSKGYYESETYLIVKEFCRLIRTLIRDGINNGEIIKDVSPWFLMQVILGSIEHVVLPCIIFDKPYNTDQFAENLFQIIFKNILTDNA